MTKKTTPDPLSFAEIQAKKTAVTKKTEIQIDGEIAIELEALNDELIDAKRFDRHNNKANTEPAVQKKIDKLTAKASKTLITFEFKSIGRLAYDKLVGEHPPLAKHKKENAQFNSETFPPALIAATVVSPEMTLEQATDMFNDPNWNGSELLKLFYAAYGVNNETGEIPKSRGGSDTTSNSLLNSLIAMSEESPTPSS